MNTNTNTNSNTNTNTNLLILIQIEKLTLIIILILILILVLRPILILILIIILILIHISGTMVCICILFFEKPWLHAPSAYNSAKALSSFPMVATLTQRNTFSVSKSLYHCCPLLLGADWTYGLGIPASFRTASCASL